MTPSKLVCALITLFLAIAVHAQDVSGAISGTVLDPSGAAVANARVTVTNTDRNQVVRVFTSDSGGAYSVPGIPIGRYSVTAEATGFSTTVVENITVNVNDDIKLNLTLTVGAVTDRVTVQAEVAAVELNTAASATTIAGTQIRELSLATRNYEQLVGLMPGVSANQTDQLFIGVGAPAGTANTMPFSINGQRNSANNWTLDGADNVDRGGNLTLLN